MKIILYKQKSKQGTYLVKLSDGVIGFRNLAEFHNDIKYVYHSPIDDNMDLIESLEKVDKWIEWYFSNREGYPQSAAYESDVSRDDFETVTVEIP